MIHWAWMIPIAFISGAGGFMCCALLVMAKQSDEHMERMCDEMADKQNGL